VVIKCHHHFLEGSVKTGFKIYGAKVITMIFVTIQNLDFQSLLPKYDNSDFWCKNILPPQFLKF